MVDPLQHPTLSSLENKSWKKKMERKKKYADLAVQGTNNSSIASKRSVESIYLPKLGVNKNVNDPTKTQTYFKFFVPKAVNRSPSMNRGYWLRLHAIRSRLQSILNVSTEKVLVVNLGCGFDPLPFEMLDNENQDSLEFLDRYSFLDVDYSDLLKNKIHVISKNPELSKIIGFDGNTKEGVDNIDCDNYFIRPCDLNDSQAYEKLMNCETLPALRDPNVIKVFIAEMSLEYIKPDFADSIISASSKLPNSHFLLLEQAIPQGPSEPFAKQMLKHFKQNDSPLQSVLKYNTVESQITRFEDLGFSNVNAGNMFKLWNLLDREEKHKIEEIQPFDELEEFHFFCHTYFICHATNNMSFEFTKEYKFAAQKEVPTDINIIENTEIKSFDIDFKRSFGSACKLDNFPSIFYNGGSNPGRLNETLQIESSLDQYAELEKGGILPPARACHSFTQISDNIAIIIGGRNAPHKAYQDTWIYNREQNEWTQGTDLPETRFRHTTLSLEENKLLIFGGNTKGSPFLIYDHNLQTFEVCDVLDNIIPKSLVSASVSFNQETKKGCVIGGYDYDTDTVSDSMFVFTVNDENVIKIEKEIKHPLFERYGSKCVPVGNDEILLIGGTSPDVVFDDKTSIIMINLETDVVRGIQMPQEFWENHPLFLVGFDLVILNEDTLVVLGGGATCYAFGSVSNESFTIKL